MSRFAWGSRSLVIREELMPELQEFVDVVLDTSPFDLSLTDGHRGQIQQDTAFASGASEVQWPNSKHNRNPSEAVHIDPYPIDYENWLLYYCLAGVIWTVSIGFPDLQLRWGGDWNTDRQLNAERFRDLAHWEVVRGVQTMEA